MKDADPFLDEPFMSRWNMAWWGWVLLVVAAVLVIAGTVKMLRPQMDERLYARFRKLPEAAFVVPADSCCSDIADACQLYNQKKYTKALAAFQQSAPNRFASEIMLYKGICLLELNQMQPAESMLAPLAGQSSFSGKEADWYIALSRLRRHDREGCLSVLRQMPPENPRYATAQQLLSRLK